MSLYHQLIMGRDSISRLVEREEEDLNNYETLRNVHVHKVIGVILLGIN